MRGEWLCILQLVPIDRLSSETLVNRGEGEREGERERERGREREPQ